MALTDSIDIQVHCTYAQDKTFYRAYMNWRDLPADRRQHTGGFTNIYSSDTDTTYEELCSLVWLMMPEEHFQMERGPDRLRDRELWESRARVVEETLIRKAFPETVEELTLVGDTFQMNWPWHPPQVKHRSLQVHPYGLSILLFQDSEGVYQCFLPDSVWLGQFRDCQDAIASRYSSAQQTELKLVWTHNFLQHEYAGVRV